VAPRRRRRLIPIVAVSGPSGSGKTRLLTRLVPALVRRGLRVGAIKHTGHAHDFDQPGKDTDVIRRAGAIAAVIEGPRGVAYFGPPTGGARALVRLLPPVDVVLAEGWKREPLPRIEVHRRSVSRAFLCATDRRVFAVVTDTPPPRTVPVFYADDVEPLADLLCARFGLSGPPAGRARLRVRPAVSRLPAKGSERTIALGRRRDMAKTTNRRGGTRGARSGGRAGSRGGSRSSGARGSSSRSGASRSSGSRSSAGKKGGMATLRTRGPEFYSEIGKKGARSRRSAKTKTGGSRSSSSSSSRTGGRSRGGGRGGARGGSSRSRSK
jgi:molybdopterin-guanine dinucleotide biosynthesis adapter protein